MSNETTSRGFIRSDNALLLGLASLKLLIHLYTNAFAGYGIFRDELYYLACSEHPALGYVDQPPLSIWILSASRMLFGDSVFALRLLPAFAGAATVFVIGLIARELGGRRFAEALAALAAVFSLIKLGMDSIYSMNSIDHLAWALTFLVCIRLIKNEHSGSNSQRQWLLLGIILGLGLLNKISVAWLGAGLFTGMLLTNTREWLTTRWPWIAGVIACLIFLPFIIWNVQNNFAHLEFIRNATGGKYSGLTPLSFLRDQILINNPASLVVWLGGLFYLLFDRDGKRFRMLAFIYMTAFTILILNQHSKGEYLAPAYAALFAAGGVAIEKYTAIRPWLWLRPLVAVPLILSGILLAPFAIPILPVDTYIRYADALGVAPSTAESKELDKLPQFYADMFGWEDKAKAVADVYRRLSPEEQSACAIFADNYGRCAAIDYFGPTYGLPKSIGRHNNYWIWGPRDYTGEIVIILGGDLEGKKDRFESVEIAGTVSSQYSMPYENNLRIYLCRKLKGSLQSIWAQLKHYD